MNVFKNKSMISAPHALYLFIGALRPLSFYRHVAPSQTVRPQDRKTVRGFVPSAFSLLLSAFCFLLWVIIITLYNSRFS